MSKSLDERVAAFQNNGIALRGMCDDGYGNEIDLINDLHTALQKAEAWKESAMRVEELWDCQAIAALIGVPLGQDIRAEIQPYIEGLQAENARLRQELDNTIEKIERIVERHT